MIDHSNVSTSALVRLILSFGICDKASFRADKIEGENEVHTVDFYSEELNPDANYNTHELIALSLMFIMLTLVSSFYKSDVL